MRNSKEDQHCGSTPRVVSPVDGDTSQVKPLAARLPAEPNRASNFEMPCQETVPESIPSLPPPTCKVYTPKSLAEAMVRAINPGPEDLWLDPCVGPGAFVSALQENGTPKERIVGVDIESAQGPYDSAATTIRGVDFLRWCASTPSRFSKIVANPPYVALCKLDKTLQDNVQSFSNESDQSFALRSNYWCAFLAASLRVLKADGCLAFVLPAAWDYALYAETLRGKILGSFRLVEVHRSHEPLFPNVREGSVVLVARGFEQSPESATRFDHSTAAALINALQGPGPQVKRVSVPIPDPAHASTTLLSDLFTVGIGCVTGDVNYFLLTEQERLSLGLPVTALVPVLSRARHLVVAQVGKQQWDRLRRANERVWLFNPGAQSLRSKAVQSYIRHGEKTCKLDGYKLRNRDPWYVVPDIRPGIGFMSGMASTGPWLSLRSMRGLAATNTLYVVSLKRAMSVDEQAAWGLSILSSYTRNQVHARVRRYPDGLKKLEPHDISSLRLLPPRHLRDSLETYRKAVRFLLSGDTPAAKSLADESVIWQRPGGDE